MKSGIIFLCLFLSGIAGNFLFAQPTITSFSPASGNVGSTVTITGTNFSSVTKVFFGAAPTTGFIVVNSTTITATVPANAYRGTIAVETSAGFVLSQADFRVNNPQQAALQSNQNNTYCLRNGILYAWGAMQLGDGTDPATKYCPVQIPMKGSLTGKTVAQVAVGYSHVIILASDGTVHSFGSEINNYGQLGNGSTAGSALPVEITINGSLTGKTVVQVGAGLNTSLAITSDGDVHTWGDPSQGKLGNGKTTGNVTLPTSIGGVGTLSGKTIIKASVSGTNVILLASDGTLHGFGNNAQGALGNGTSGVQATPIAVDMSGVLSGKTICQFISMDEGTLAIDDAGAVYGWGSANIVAGTASNVPVAMSMGSLGGKKMVYVSGNLENDGGYAVDKGGAIHIWGSGAHYALGNNSTTDVTIPSTLSVTGTSLNGKTVVGFAGGTGRAMVLASDGTYHVWGWSVNGGMADGQSSVDAKVSQLVNFPAKPTVESVGISFTGLSSTGATINWFKGNGKKRLVIVKATNPISVYTPSDGMSYAANTNYTLAASVDSGRVVYAGTGNTVTITGLSNGITYNVAVFEYDTAKSPCNMNYYKLGKPLLGNFVASTPLVIPTVSTGSITLVTGKSASLGGDVTGDGGATVTERGIVYATTANPTVANSKTIMGSGLGAYAAVVTGLAPNTTYHVRAYAINSVGTAYGADSVFKTLPGAPVVITGKAISITTTTASLGGNVTNDGGATVTERGIVYATTSNPTLASTKVQIGTGTGVFSQNVTGLTTNTTYHVRAYAINSIDTSYGADSTFTTLASPAAVSTAAATAVTANSATMGGNVLSDGGATVTERGVVYATTANPTTADTKVQIGSGTGAFSQNVTGLTANTTYHVRAYAINAAGTSYGSDITFTTLATGIYIPGKQAAIIECYPNPARDMVYIQSTVPFTSIILVNGLGQIVARAGGSNKIEVGSLATGIYFIQLYDRQGLAGTQKVIVQ